MLMERYFDDLLSHGRETFVGPAAQAALNQSREAFQSAIKRARKKGRLASPWRNFFVVLRPEDRSSGAPDPVRWIDPLMKHLGLDYRVSLLRAAAAYGSSHQASMVFQVVAPRQLRSIEVGRHRIQFLFQQPEAFAAVNRAPWLRELKSESGFAKCAGIELTLLDSMRYLHKAGGMNGVAQIVRDIGGKARARALAGAAEAYENSAVRRLGYLLERFGHEKQARALSPFARTAKSLKPLDPSARSYLRAAAAPVSAEWRLSLNRKVEVEE
jgi:predicted transcriptional regulator of viral defense system